MNFWIACCGVCSLYPKSSSIIFARQKQVSAVSARDHVSAANVLFTTHFILLECQSMDEKYLFHLFVTRATCPPWESPSFKFVSGTSWYAINVRCSFNFRSLTKASSFISCSSLFVLTISATTVFFNEPANSQQLNSKSELA